MTLTNDLPLTLDTWRSFLLTDWFTLCRGHGTTRLRDFRARATGTIPAAPARQRRASPAGRWQAARRLLPGERLVQTLR